MTSTAVRNSTALSAPLSQTTAPVHEFRCLYTHDLRKKQKKWQDGRVKYHTFNRRVMLYDDTLNFIDDTHWKEGGVLQGGDQVTLDAGVLVDLDELLVTTQTDLAPLWDKDKNKQHQLSSNIVRPVTDTLVRDASILSTGRNIGNGIEVPKQKHRSLNALLGNAQGAFGKALLPSQSPYEARKANQENDWMSIREVKRQKTGNGLSRSVAGSPHRERYIPSSAKTSGENSEVLAKPVQQQLGSHVQESLLPHSAVHISSDTAVPFSDVTPSSSPKPTSMTARIATMLSKPSTSVPCIPQPSSPSYTPAGPSSPSISTTSKVRHVEVLLDEDDDYDNKVPTPVKAKQMPELELMPTIAKRKQLRLAKPQQRPMLMCQKMTVPSTTVARPPGKLTQKRRPKLLSLSDVEDELDAATMKPTRNKMKMNISQPSPCEQVVVDFTNDPSSSTAVFDTGKSSSPQRTAARRKEIGVIQRSVVDSIEAGHTTLTNLLTTANPKTIVAKVAQQKPQPDHDASNTRKKQSRRLPKNDLMAIDDERENHTDLTSAKKIMKKQKVVPSKKSAIKKDKTLAKKAAKVGQSKTLRSIIDKSNEAAGEDSEGIGSNAMEEHAKALAAAGPHKDQGAWSIEATDLFDWRPPDWAERAKKMGIAI